MDQIIVIFPDDTKKYVELQSNNRLEEYSYLPEFEGVEEYLKDMNPKVALDVGSGIGRASVFFFKYFKWTDTLFILADGDSGNEQLSGIRTGKQNPIARSTGCRILRHSILKNSHGMNFLISLI